MRDLPTSQRRRRQRVSSLLPCLALIPSHDEVSNARCGHSQSSCQHQRQPLQCSCQSDREWSSDTPAKWLWSVSDGKVSSQASSSSRDSCPAVGHDLSIVGTLCTIHPQGGSFHWTSCTLICRSSWYTMTLIPETSVDDLPNVGISRYSINSQGMCSEKPHCWLARCLLFAWKGRAR